MNRRQTSSAFSALLLAPVLLLGACSSGQDEAPASPSASEDCPVTPLDVVVSVDQWGDIVQALAGSCASVHTVIASSSVDPHNYEPSPADAVVFDAADLVVVNGADYDHWASDLAANAASSPAVVDAGEVVGAADGSNPHLWYSPTYVTDVAEAVTDELSSLSPDAKDYFTEQHTAWTSAMSDYTALVEKLKSELSDRTYAATESVFDLMAQAIGLQDVTPEGFARAAANESDPTPNDVAAFESALTDGSVDVLIYNSQTEGSTPEQIRDMAEQADVPVVEVTESVAPGSSSFQDWQVSQLDALAKALGVDA